MKLYTQVKSIEPIENIPLGTSGIIVHKYDRKNYEVEFFDNNKKKHIVYGVVTVKESDIMKDGKFSTINLFLATTFFILFEAYYGNTLIASTALALIMIINYAWFRLYYAKLMQTESYKAIVSFIVIWAVLQIAVIYLR